MLNKFYTISALLVFSLLFVCTLSYGQQQNSITVKDSIPKDTTISEDALESIVYYNANDSMKFDLKNQKMYLFGRATVNYNDISIQSEIIEMNLDSNTVLAKGIKDSTGKFIGEPVFKEKQQEFKAHEIKYNYNTKKGLITDVITQEDESYIHGEKIKKLENDVLYIKNGKYTTCNLEHPHFYFYASKLKVIPDDKIITGPANLVIEDVPTPLAIPFGFFPNKKGQKSGIVVPQPGESAAQGFFLANGGYYFGISDKMDLQLTGDIYSKGSWAARLQSNYKVRYKFNGNFNTSFSTTKNSYKEFPDYSERKDFFIRWKHQQDAKARPGSRFSADVNAGTSSNFTNNFYSTGADYLTNTFASNISYSKSFLGTPFNFTLNARHSQNANTHIVNLTLPEATFSMNRINPLKRKNRVGQKKFYENIGVSYTLNSKNEINIADSLLAINDLGIVNNYMRNGIKHNIPLSTNIKFLKYFSLNPSFNYTELWYFNYIQKYWDNNNNRLVTDTINNFKSTRTYNTSVNLTTKIYGMYQYKGKRIKAIRHVLTPSIGFSYLPENNFGIQTYTDTNNISYSYSIFENNIYGALNSSESGFVNFNLINNFEMKVLSKKDTLHPLKKVKLLENLGISSSYNIYADSLNWSDIKLNARTNIAKFLSLNFNGTLDPYALNTSGVKINTSEWKINNNIGRLTNAVLAVSMSFRSKQSKNKDYSKTKASEEEIDYIKNNSNQYVDFEIPWSLSLSYNIRYSKPQFTETFTQTLSFSGDVSITKKWKIGFTSGYDFKAEDLSYTSVDIYRDLHCWDMKFNWIPFGPRQSYMLTIQVKASVLQDLKLTRRSLPVIF
ncbi:MAG: putative LPS assembly protein LptD [Vicingaceae bacterium]